jgi:hypothetical protein
MWFAPYSKTSIGFSALASEDGTENEWIGFQHPP